MTSLTRIRRLLPADNGSSPECSDAWQRFVLDSLVTPLLATVGASVWTVPGLVGWPAACRGWHLHAGSVCIPHVGP